MVRVTEMSHSKPIKCTLDVGGQERKFLRIEPESPTGELFIWFHGSTQSASVTRRFTDNTFDRLAARGTTVVYPEGIARHWNDSRAQLPEKTRELGTDDVAFARALVEALSPTRVVAAGYSNGGQMVMRLLHDAYGLLDAAAIVAANQPAPSNFLSSAEGFRPTPILLMHGTADPMSPFGGGIAAPKTGHERGDVLSFAETADYYAGLNGATLREVRSYADSLEQAAVVATYEGAEGAEGTASVEAWALHGVGHVVPAPRQVPSRYLGPSTRLLVAAKEIARFCGLEY